MIGILILNSVVLLLVQYELKLIDVHKSYNTIGLHTNKIFSIHWKLYEGNIEIILRYNVHSQRGIMELNVD